MKDNLFDEKVDALFYLFTYVVFPVLSVYMGLNNIEDNNVGSLVYWYLTILCSVLCCLHDCANRWKDGSPKRKGKLFLMTIVLLVIIIYSITIIFFHSITFQGDLILFFFCI